MLTQSFKQNIQDNPTSISGGVPSNQPMDDKSFNEWIKPTSNTSNSIVEAAKSGIEQTKSGYKDAVKAKNPLDLVSNSVKAGAGVVNTALSPLAPITKPIGDAVNALSNKISDIPAVQEFAKSKFGENTSKITDFLNNLNTIAGAVAGVKASPELATKVVDTAKKGIDTVKNAVKTPPLAPEVIQANLEKSGIKDTTPSYDKSLIGEPNIKNADGTITPRLKSIDKNGNPFAVPEVTSTPMEIAAGKELSKVEGYNPKATTLSKYNFSTKAIADKSNSYRASLANEKVIVPKKEMVSLIKKSVNEASQNSLLIQKTDPIVKNYIRVATRASQTVDGTLAGMDKLRLALDQAYDDAGGKYGNNKGLDQIHRAARNAITKDMIAKAKTTEVKASLKQMENLYNASDVLKDEARKAGGSKWEQFTKKHPIIKAAGQKALNLIGVGEVVNHL